MFLGHAIIDVIEYILESEGRSHNGLPNANNAELIILTIVKLNQEVMVVDSVSDK
ncbi:16577_t:CDS:2 [Rhizophagus irregularis]|nr:16577_t:CDS:2 [Rhizophagus irregularis]